MTDWFRSWHGAPTDPKWLLIARRAGVAPGIVSAVMWALLDHASQEAERGRVDRFDVETYAVFSGFAEEDIAAVITAMSEKGVIQNGRLTAWEKRQPKREDGSSERAKEWRERNRTQPNANEHRVEEIREEKKEDIRTVANATRPERDQKFEEFKKAYPRRNGGNPWKPAKAQWDACLKAGASPDQIISAVKAGVGFDPAKIGTEYIPQAVKWLRDRRYEDHAPAADNVVPMGFYAAADSDELCAWDAHCRKTKGANMPRDKNGGWYVSARWPPGYENSAAATG